MKCDHFKRFYFHELSAKNKIQEYLLIKDKAFILIELIKDDFYKFDYFLVIKFIELNINDCDFNFDLENQDFK